SAVDITSGLVIWLTARAIKKRDPYMYPRGRTRLEPIALTIRRRRRQQQGRRRLPAVSITAIYATFSMITI
ncbi:unnamed protein product, partial [Cercopithifilaria johnstoni]